MADVDMTDAPPAAVKKGGAKKAGGGEGSDGKKRFEVKKVEISRKSYICAILIACLVECGSFVGMGYCG